jgi:hypothetical protein
MDMMFMGGALLELLVRVTAVYGLGGVDVQQPETAARVETG